MSVDSGPTTVGSIVGKLKMDRDQWLADLAATKQDIRDLERANPDVHVGATVGEALSKLAAVDEAQKRVADRTDKVSAAQVRLKAAMSAADSAYARAELAQMRLTEMQERGTAQGARLAAAELAVSEAMKRLDAANDRATRSEAALAAAQQAAAAAAVEEAAAQDQSTRAKVKANEANSTAVTRVGAIATAVALLVPLLAPVGAVAVGVAGGLAGMGAAGVLALIGIKREMDAGTKVGAAYKDGLGDLKNMFFELSATAAVNTLASFQRVVGEMRRDMPSLNTQVGQFATILGRSGAALFSGAINSLRVLNPLFLTAGIYLQRVSEGFERWTRGQGIQDFGGYALSMLPSVTELLGKLASMVMHILQALAPLGTVGIAVLSGIAGAINAIPVQVLSALIASVTWGAIAFKAWGFIAPLLAVIAERIAYAAGSMTLLNSAITIGTGPIGWVVAGLSALAGVFAVVIAQNTGATQAMQDYTAAVQADSGAIGENVRQKAAQKLLDAGVLDAAKKLKVSTQDVVAATLGNADAQARLNMQLQMGTAGSAELEAQLKRTGLPIDELQTQILILEQGMKSNSDAVTGEIERYKTLQDALAGATTATKQQQQADEAVAASLGISVGALQAARAGQTDMKAATEKATAEMYLQNDAAGLLRSALDLLNGKTIGAAQAQNRFDSSLANMGAHIDKTGKDVDRATTSLEGMSAAAVANRGELISSVQAAQDAAQAYRDNGASSDEARQKLIDMKQAIIEHATELGEDRGQVEALINQLFRIPETVPKTKVEVDTSQAIAGIKSFIADYNGKTIHLNVGATGPSGATIVGNPSMGYKANGGTAGLASGGTAGAFVDALRGLAGGGTGGTVYGPGDAHSDTAGLFRLARGEEVISNRFGQADRNRATLKQINAGFTPAPLTVPAQPRVIKQQTVEQHFHIQGVAQEDPRVLAAIVSGEAKRQFTGIRLR